MVDGILGLVILFILIRGISKGALDTLLKLIGNAGGLFLGFMYSGKVTEYLSGTQVPVKIHDHIYTMIRAKIGVDAGDSESKSLTLLESLGQPKEDPIAEAMPKTLGSAVNDLVDKTADAAADRLTEIAISILSVVIIVLAVTIVIGLIRLIIRRIRRKSHIISFADRTLGFGLGVIVSLIVSFIILAAAVPVTTLAAPDRVPELIEAIHESHLASVIYNINPIMLIITRFLG